MLSCCPNKWWLPVSSAWLNSLSFTRFFQPSPNRIQPDCESHFLLACQNLFLPSELSQGDRRKALKHLAFRRLQTPKIVFFVKQVHLKRPALRGFVPREVHLSLSCAFFERVFRPQNRPKAALETALKIRSEIAFPSSGCTYLTSLVKELGRLFIEVWELRKVEDEVGVVRLSTAVVVKLREGLDDSDELFILQRMNSLASSVL